MPRKKQTVQKQRRRKVYAQGEMQGAAETIKPRGFFKFFGNYTLFAVIGAVALAGGSLTFLLVGQGNSTTSGSVRGEGVTRTQRDEQGTPIAEPTLSTRRFPAPPPLTIDTTKTYTATIKTAKGDIKVELLDDAATNTVNNFVFLAEQGFYNGLTFHRVIGDAEGQVRLAQAGDPTGTGSDGPGYDLPFEKTDLPFDGPLLAMAKPQEASAPNNGSQFFFTLQAEPSYDGKFTVFGRVVEGTDVLEKLTPRNPQLDDDLPPGDVIESVEIQTS